MRDDGLRMFGSGVARVSRVVEWSGKLILCRYKSECCTGQALVGGDACWKGGGEGLGAARNEAMGRATEVGGTTCYRGRQ